MGASRVCLRLTTVTDSASGGRNLSGSTARAAEVRNRAEDRASAARAIVREESIRWFPFRKEARPGPSGHAANDEQGISEPRPSGSGGRLHRYLKVAALRLLTEV